MENSNPHSQYRPSTQPTPLGGLGKAPGSRGWLLGGGPQARPAPGRRLARPARLRLRGLSPAWPWRLALQRLRRQVSLPFILAPKAWCPAGACGVVRVACRPNLSPGLRYRLVPETCQCFCSARNGYPRDRAATLPREGASAPGERHPGANQSPKLVFFLAVPLRSCSKTCQL